MIDLNNLYKNFFDDPVITDGKLNKFAEIHLERLRANNGGGEFTQLITDTTNAYQLFASAVSVEDVNFAQQQGLTIKVGNLLKDMKLFISKAEGLVRSEFGKKSDEYQEFFPYKVKEYWHFNFKNAEMLVSRFISAADKYSAQLGPAIKTNLQTLLNDFRSAREDQLRKKGEVADSKTNVRKRREELEIQLLKNLHYIGFIYPGNINRCNDFFDQSYLRRRKKREQ